MDFITRLARTSREHDLIMVVVEELKNVRHFIPVRSTCSANDVAQAFIRHELRFHDVPKNIR